MRFMVLAASSRLTLRDLIDAGAARLRVRLRVRLVALLGRFLVRHVLDLAAQEEGEGSAQRCDCAHFPCWWRDTKQ